jgi:uncharacterized repeat protein (TIGR04076 family)
LECSGQFLAEQVFAADEVKVMSKVKAKVIGQKGHCRAGHALGDVITFDWDTNEIGGTICLHALYSSLPKIYALAHGGDVAFATDEEGKKVARHACPDGANPVIFELSII